MRSTLPVLLRPFVPLVRAWIARTVRQAEPRARPLDAPLHSALERHFRPRTLARARVVCGSPLPAPPVPTLGFARLRAFKHGSYVGLTLQDTVFIRPEHAADAGLLAHELVHVLQWARLGPRVFVERYAQELLEAGYGDGPLERMAYAHEARFRAGEVYDLETAVQRELDVLLRG